MPCPTVQISVRGRTTQLYGPGSTVQISVRTVQISVRHPGSDLRKLRAKEYIKEFYLKRLCKEPKRVVTRSVQISVRSGDDPTPGDRPGVSGSVTPGYVTNPSHPRALSKLLRLVAYGPCRVEILPTSGASER